MTLQKRIIQLLKLRGLPMTATSISCELNAKLSSLSSILKKMSDERIISRIKNFGPRGGYGYEIKESIS